MAEDQGKEEEKFDFTLEGEAIGYISLDQARLLAMSIARETPGDYGCRFKNVPMALEVVTATEEEDSYTIPLSFRPQGDFSGTPGQEQFFIEKEGVVAHRQVLGLPRTSGRRRFPAVPVIAGILAVLLVGGGAVFVAGGLGRNGGPQTQMVAPVPTGLPTGNADGDGGPQTQMVAQVPTSLLGRTATTVLPVAVEATKTPIPTSGAVLSSSSTHVPPASSSRGLSGMRRGASISGRVTDAETGLPIMDVYFVAGPGRGDDRVSWAHTDGNGNYILEGLPAGEIRIDVDDNQGYLWESTTVRVSEGEELTGVDFSFERGASISGRVTDAETGLPILDVGFGASSVEGDQVSWAYTDGNGNYTLGGLPSGEIKIDVNDSQGYIGESTTVRVSEGEELTGVDFSFERGASISGQVTDSGTGLPIRDMDVDAKIFNGDHVAWTMTDVNGMYMLESIPDGVIDVNVFGQGYVEQGRTVIVQHGEDVTGVDF